MSNERSEEAVKQQGGGKDTRETQAYLHTLTIDGVGTHKRVTLDRAWPFKDYAGVSGSTSTAELVFRGAPPSAPVGVEAAVREVIESINRFRDAGTRPGDGTLVHWEATLHRALAQQPAAVEGLPSNALIDSLETKDALRAMCKVLRDALAQQPAAVDEDVRELLDAMDSGADPRPAFLRLRKRFPATQHQEPTT